jgi:uncharacterized membrane protein YgcG
MILMLSMAERDFATFFYGEDTQYAFNSYGQQQLESHFLDCFAVDDWYGGFLGYLTAAEDFMAKAAAGEPVRENPRDLTMLFVLIAVFVSFVITRVQWMRMANVATQKSASRYLTGDGLVLTHSRDQFTHRTVTRRKVEQNNSGASTSRSGASTSRSGGGGSGRSGKF